MNEILNRLHSQGLVKSMILPKDWIKTSEEKEPLLWEFQEPHHEQVKLCFFYRGHRIPPGPAEDFRRLLHLPEHELTEEEFTSIEIVVRNAAYSDEFARKRALTETINGIKVLKLEGCWQDSALQNLAIFIDSDKTGSAVQEIHYLAPMTLYNTYLEEVTMSLNSIVWKEV